MTKLLVLELDGTFEEGFSARLEIRQNINAPREIVRRGLLPANEKLFENYCKWQENYYQLEGFRALKDRNPQQITNSSLKQDAIAECQTMANLVEQQLNHWLNSSKGFETIKKEILRSGDNFRFWLQTNNTDLQKLPWEKWELLQEADAEVAIIASEYKISLRKSQPNNKIRILGILGDAADLKCVEKDQQVLAEISKKSRKGRKNRSRNYLEKRSNCSRFYPIVSRRKLGYFLF